jgi:glucosamine 6-phosphate synthetase-like amidotransferase/phosphosugar isomerase protein
MCGIAGIINYGQKTVPGDLIEGLWESLDARGGDACGVYFRGFKPSKKKSEVTPKLESRLIRGPWRVKDMLEEQRKNWGDDYDNYNIRLMLLHTRAKTHGDERENVNNMPIFNPEFTMVHNGVIWSSAKDKEYPYLGDVDSENILAQIDKNRKAGQWATEPEIAYGMKEAPGSRAVLLLHHPANNLYIYRDGNPLEVQYLRSNKLLIFSSKADYIPFSYTGEESTFSDMTKLNMPATIPEEFLLRLDLGLKKPGMEYVAQITRNKMELYNDN